ncbi:MAG: UDP-N-acetylmuramate:L-alanyl-gamma-D-glutamyl-meso-diaminopimelate ligase [SAR324 cluster bacterium]|nr:UDP-N-acetylmuramate:L-alanyl-gamma-D-glutamyl-meso-diaminopimelate ligase [SAR324 cluster bacterium]
MKTLNQSRHIHFSGICGTAMASLAVLLKNRGIRITGSDNNVYPPMSTFLEQNSIAIFDGYSEKNFPEIPDLVVLGNALSRGNPEVEWVMAQKIPYISMAELLKLYFIRGNTSLVVTGTHGKTTTTSLLSWVFDVAGKDPGFMVGGIVENFGTSCREGYGGFFITEGDEYDTAFFDKRSKFFHYLPDLLILNNIEFDHADIFDSLQDILKAFRYLLRLVPQNGLIVANGDDANVMSVIEHAFTPCVTFGKNLNCMVQIRDIMPVASGTTFTLHWRDRQDYEFQIPLMGEYNVSNATAVAISAIHYGITPEQIQRAFDLFSGVKRRQELRGIARGVLVYDDFAHHPTAIQKTIQAIRQRHPRQRVFAVFEPRSNTSVINVHQAAMVSAFEGAHEAIIALPYRFDKIPVEKRLDIQAVEQQMRERGQMCKTFARTEDILEYLVSTVQSGDVVLIMSNGKFDNIHLRLLEMLE